MFTATAILQLVEIGKLRLDDFVCDYLPWLKNHQDSRFKELTIRHLLSHRAGLARDTSEADYWELKTPFPNRSVTAICV